MTTQTTGVKALLKELEAGKKQLKTEYDRSIHAIDVAIRILTEAKLDPTDMVSGSTDSKGPGRPTKGDFNLKALIKKVRGKGKRGRPIGSRAQFHGNLTQTVYETVIGNKRFIHNRDIVELLIKGMPKNEKIDRVDFAKKISVLLASLKKQGRLVTYQEGGYRKNMFWGAPEWMGADGKINRSREFKKM
jgi:hypothetical protein